MSGMQDVKASVREDDLSSSSFQLMNAVCNLLERPYHPTMIASRCAPSLAPTCSRGQLPAGFNRRFSACSETRLGNLFDRSANAVHPLLAPRRSQRQGSSRPRTGCQPRGDVLHFRRARRWGFRGIRDRPSRSWGVESEISDCGCRAGDSKRSGGTRGNDGRFRTFSGSRPPSRFVRKPPLFDDGAFVATAGGD